MKVPFSAVFALAWWLVLPPAAVACLCGTPADPCVAVKAADVVFVGRAVDIERGSLEPADLLNAMVRFEVAEVLHGIVPKVVRLPEGDEGGCQFAFREGRDYVVYARYHEGVLKAYLCGRTGQLDDRRHDVDILRERRHGTPVPRLAGRVMDARQHVGSARLPPFVGVTVTAQQGTDVRRTVTDADGRFLFMNIPAGDYKVTADLPGIHVPVVGRNATVKVGCYGKVDMQVTLVPLHGTLATADGNPESLRVAIRAVAIDRSQRTASTERTTFTFLAGDGTWSFDRLPPGEYVISVGDHFRWDPLRMPFWYPAATRREDAEIVRIEANGVVQLALRHPPPPRESQFSGVIVDHSGTPAPGGRVVLHDVDVDHDVANGSADAQGRFEVRGWEGRRYSITAYDCEGRVPRMSASVPINPQSAEPLRIVLTRSCPGRSP